MLYYYAPCEFMGYDLLVLHRTAGLYLWQPFKECWVKVHNPSIEFTSIPDAAILLLGIRRPK